ncbi:MAG TPA: 3-deoxy-7-phosphoheptulonate synthase [Polyangiaceae bacterium]|nr:3-deoxy-7-phosphoheptulonate synthase [Polyangiaceae bacterium]
MKTSVKSHIRPALDPESTSTSSHLLSPGELLAQHPLSPVAAQGVQHARRRLSDRIVTGHGAPMAIVGPCSIHCETAALEYAERLRGLQKRLGDSVQLVMRVYFEKPRTTVGWKGFLYDPDLDGSGDLGRGLVRARKLLVDIAELDVPIATELLDPLTTPYIADCLSWVAIGARTSESQIHRQVASGLLCPVGFKNATDGSVEVAHHAIEAARNPHTYLGINEAGQVAIMNSAGNAACHVVLRGGKHGPNYQKYHVETVAEQLRRAGHAPRVLVDCSHQNSGKDHNNQPQVARAVFAQMQDSSADVLGVMIESHLRAGRQDINGPREYGVSLTDACIDFSTTERVLEELAQLAS